MESEYRGSDVVDPLQGYWGLSLFPKTFGVFPDPSKPFDPNHDLQAIHTHLNSLALRSPGKLKEQAKIILNSASMSCQVSKGKIETVPAKSDEDPRERRPALGHKRARFSLKPVSREPAVSLEPTLDVKKLKNPEDFFMAYERLENAKREIQKQMSGNLSDSDQFDPSPVVSRRRRPGITWRSARYEHHYPSVNYEGIDNVASSQEKVEPSSQREKDKNHSSQEMESAGKTGHMSGRLLEDLLSHSNEDLEGEGAVNLLLDRLNIKPLDLGELFLPDQDISKVSLKSSREIFPKHRQALSHIDNALKVNITRTPLTLRQGTENCSASPTPLNLFASVALLSRRNSIMSPASDPFSPHDIDPLHETENYSATPPQPKGPFASPSLLNRRISLSSPSSDPFSPHDIDQLPLTNPSPIEHTSQRSGSADVGKQSDKMKSPLNEQDGKARSNEVPIRDFSQASEKPKGPFASPSLLNRRISLSSPSSDPFSPHDIDQLPLKNPSPIEHTSQRSGSADVGKQSDKMKSPLNEQDGKARSNEVPIRDFSQASENCVNEDSVRLDACIDDLSASHVAVENQATGINMENMIMNETLGVSDADEDAQANRITVEEKVQDMTREAMSLAQHDLDMMDSALDNSNDVQSQLGTTHDNHTMNGQSGTSNNDAEQHEETIHEESRMTADKQSKAKSHPLRRKDKQISRQKKSLAGTASLKNHMTDGLSETPDNEAEQHNEMQKESSIKVNDESRVKSRPRGGHRDKEISRRKSLAGAGTIWKSGVRRSTRIRTRPLEYWKGERLLYGRIHESLATVIGMKYASPAKEDGRPTLKVKSFVSDEFKELVDLAALH